MPKIARPAAFPRVIAHRGASLAAPENTLPAFAAARDAGAGAVEFDVSLLGDGTPVVVHDATLDRCSDAAGPLSGIGAGDLARIDAGAWFGPAFAGTRIPTLAEALDGLAALGLWANLELKPQGAPSGPMVAAVAAELGARPWTAERVVVSSFAAGALAALARARPAQPLAMLWDAPPAGWPAALADLGAGSMHVAAEHLDPALCAAARAEGVALRVYTVNDPTAIAGARGPDLAGVITDAPGRFLADPAWADWVDAAG